MKIGDQVFRAVLDTGATLSIVARRLLKTFKKTKTVAKRVGDGRTIHSLGGVDVTICLGDETLTQHCRVLDTDAFDIVIGTDFRRNPQVKMLSLQRPYTYDFSSCFFPKFKKSTKKGFSREMTYFFGFYGSKIGGGSSYPNFVQKYQKPEIWPILGYFCLLWAGPAEQCCTPGYLPIEDF